MLIDYKLKYLKYKEKYLHLKNQFGGELINKKTNYNKEFDPDNKQTINQLVDLNINCETVDGINGLKLSREQNVNPIENNKIFYNYKCVDKSKNTIEKSTEVNSIGDKSIRYLDRHNIDCDNMGIKDIQLKHTSDGRIKYDYKCGQTMLNNITTHETAINDNGSGANIYLDRHNVSCPNEKILTQIKLDALYPNGFDKPAKIQYKYNCGDLTLNSKVNLTPYDNSIVEFILKSTINPKFHAILWKLFYCIIEKTKTQNDFILMDSGNTLAYKVFGYPQFPWDDDIDVGFITDSLYTEYFKLMKDCLALGFNIWVYTRVKPDGIMFDSSKGENWADKNNLLTKRLTAELLSKLTVNNFWFIKITFKIEKYKLLKTKIDFKDDYFFSGLDNMANPWVDVFPFVKDESTNMYKYKFGDYTNMKTPLIITNNTINLYNINIKIPDNVTEILNKYKKPEDYLKKDTIYNHISTKEDNRKKIEYKNNEIRNFVVNYVKEHHQIINNTIQLITCDDFI